MKTLSLFMLLSLAFQPSDVPLCFGQAAKAGRPAKAELIARYKKNTLLDVSPGGDFILLYGALTPRKHRGKQGTTEWEPERGDKQFDMLRVVEWPSGRELNNLHVHAVPTAARFLDDGKQICYQVPRQVAGGKSIVSENELWDYVSGSTGKCSSAPEKGAYRGSAETYSSSDQEYQAKTSKETVKEFLVWKYVRGVVSISRRETGATVASVPHPAVKEPYDWPLTGHVYSVAFSPDGRYLLTSYEGDTYVWRIGA